MTPETAIWQEARRELSRLDFASLHARVLWWQCSPDLFFPAEPSDIYNEAAFPHEWNYGLPELPPFPLSVTDLPREGEIDFEYSKRTPQQPLQLSPSQEKHWENAPGGAVAHEFGPWRENQL